MSLLLPLLAVGVPAVAQQMPAGSFREQLDVLEVEVPVQVLDRSGKPVRGLSADRFKVFDRGTQRPIVGFEVVDLTGRPGAAGAAGSADLASSRARHFLLLFDLSYSSPTSLHRARLAAREFVLGSLLSSDLVAVATFSVEYGPRMLTSFTPDRAQVARALDTLTLQENPQRTVTVDPLAFVVPSTFSGPAPPDSGVGTAGKANEEAIETAQAAALLLERERRTWERSRILTANRGLSELARALDNVRGRKQVILFSEGFESALVVGRSAQQAEEDQTESDYLHSGLLWLVDTDQRFGNTELQSSVERTLEQFRRADCVIQAVDIGGLRAGGEAAAPRRGGQEALFLFANGTGGSLFKDANDLGSQLHRVLDRNAVSYLLTVQAPGIEPDGSYRRLRVEVDGLAGATLSYRKGYYAPRPWGELAEVERRLLAAEAIIEARPRTEIGMALLALPFQSGGPRAYVPVLLEIDGGDLLRGQASGPMPIEIYIYVTDREGTIRGYLTRTITLDVAATRPPLAESGIKYYGHFDLVPDTYLVRALVRNGATGRTGVQALPVTVAPAASTTPELLPPLALEPAGQWVMLREPVSQDGSEEVVYPFTLDGEPFVPEVSPRTRDGGPLHFCLIGYRLPAGPLSSTATLVDSVSLRETPIDGRVEGVRTVTGIAGLDKWRVTFDSRGVAPGSYELRLAIRDAEGAVLASSASPITVAD